MDLKQYFTDHKGTGVLATADGEKVNQAVYGRPHFLEDGQLAFIMRERRSLAMVQASKSAHYLFLEEGEGFKGWRISLQMIEDLPNDPRIEEIQRRVKKHDIKPETRHLVTFEVKEIRPLVGEA